MSSPVSALTISHNLIFLREPDSSPQAWNSHSCFLSCLGMDFRFDGISNVDRNYAYLAQIVSFFVILLIYYKLIRVKLNIRSEC